MINNKEFFAHNSQNKDLDELVDALKQGSYIRAVNYHETYERDIGELEKQLKFFSRYFSPVSKKDLDDFFYNREWTRDKPGLIISVFEGYKNNFKIMKPLLEKYGFTGWYFIPAGFIELPVTEQKEFASNHSIYYDTEQAEGRIAMNWDEVRKIDKKHVICSHTMTHYCFEDDSPHEILKKEIIESKALLEKKVGHEVDVFCWLGGKDFKRSPRAGQYITECGYRYLFSNNKIEKLR